jgi:hypothetical protein
VKDCYLTQPTIDQKRKESKVKRKGRNPETMRFLKKTGMESSEVSEPIIKQSNEKIDSLTEAT